MYRKILVPVSHGAVSEQGVLEGVRLARDANATLRFIHVLDASDHAVGEMGFSGTIDEFLELVDRRGATTVDNARHVAAMAGLECDAVLRHGIRGDACELVAMEALAWGAEVIVMGIKAIDSRGIRPVGVGTRILQASPVPVLAIGPPDPARRQACGPADRPVRPGRRERYFA